MPIYNLTFSPEGLYAGFDSNPHSKTPENSHIAVGTLVDDKGRTLKVELKADSLQELIDELPKRIYSEPRHNGNDPVPIQVTGNSLTHVGVAPLEPFTKNRVGVAPLLQHSPKVPAETAETGWPEKSLAMLDDFFSGTSRNDASDEPRYTTVVTRKDEQSPRFTGGKFGRGNTEKSTLQYRYDLFAARDILNFEPGTANDFSQRTKAARKLNQLLLQQTIDKGLIANLTHIGYPLDKSFGECTNILQALINIGCQITNTDIRTSTEAEAHLSGIVMTTMLGVKKTTGEVLFTLWSEDNMHVGRNVDSGEIFAGTPLDFWNKEFVEKKVGVAMLRIFTINLSPAAVYVSQFADMTKQDAHVALASYVKSKNAKNIPVAIERLKGNNLASFLDSVGIKWKVSESYNLAAPDEAEIEELIQLLEDTHQQSNIILECNDLDRDRTFRYSFTQSTSEKGENIEGLRHEHVAQTTLKKISYDSFRSLVNELRETCLEGEEGMLMDVLSTVPANADDNAFADTPALSPKASADMGELMADLDLNKG